MFPKIREHSCDLNAVFVNDALMSVCHICLCSSDREQVRLPDHDSIYLARMLTSADNKQRVEYPTLDMRHPHSSTCSSNPFREGELIGKAGRSSTVPNTKIREFQPFRPCPELGSRSRAATTHRENNPVLHVPPMLVEQMVWIDGVVAEFELAMLEFGDPAPTVKTRPSWVHHDIHSMAPSIRLEL